MARDGRMDEIADDGYWQSLLEEFEHVETPADEHPAALLAPSPSAPSAPAPPANGEPGDAAWQWAAGIQQRDESVEGVVTGFNRGGLLVKVNDLAGFVPASHMVGLTRWTSDQDRTQQLGKRIGESLRLKVIELNRAQNRFILSERLALGRQKDGNALLQAIQVGDICSGRVNHITEFGAFVDLGGIDGLIHVSEIAWERVAHPKDILRVGQELQVSVISVEPSKRRIQLSLKRLRPDPWATAAQRYHIGQIIEGVITNVTDFGAFAKVDEGLEGLVHTSELTDGSAVSPRVVVREGDHVQARILSIDGARRRLALSLKLSTSG
jgi:small subunit ribosomal protein S1